MKPLTPFTLLGAVSLAQQAAGEPQKLTIETIHSATSHTSGAPDTIKWSPDSKKVSYVVHAEQGERSANLPLRVDPVYPESQSMAHIQGDVVLDAIINKQGTIEQLTARRGQPLLRAAAIDAVRQWKYKPYLLNGDPVVVETMVTIHFDW